MDINEEMKDNGLILCKDNIIRDRKNHPKCPNAIYQHLVVKKQNGVRLDAFEDKIYGSCVLSLIEIILNNKHFRFQTEDIKEDCRGEAVLCILESVPKYFNKDKGSTAYSYAFRCGYTSMIHVLERNNRNIEKLTANLEKTIGTSYDLQRDFD